MDELEFVLSLSFIEFLLLELLVSIRITYFLLFIVLFLFINTNKYRNI